MKKPPLTYIYHTVFNILGATSLAKEIAMHASVRLSNVEDQSLSIEDRLAAVERNIAHLLTAHNEREEIDAEAARRSREFVSGCRLVLAEDQARCAGDVGPAG